MRADGRGKSRTARKPQRSKAQRRKETGRGPGWFDMPREHSLAAKGVKTAQPRMKARGISAQKKKIIYNPPSSIELVVPVPEKYETLEEMRDYLWDRYDIDISTDPEADEYLGLFYNPDLRSYMGELLDYSAGEAVMVVFPRPYVDWVDLGPRKGEIKEDGYYTKQWMKLIEDSEITLIDDVPFEEAIRKRR